LEKNGRLHEFRLKLIGGMTQRGYTIEFAEQLFEQIKGFAGYGFPESHSASFAILAYVSAWLKHYHTAEFFTALMNSQPMGFYSNSQLVQDARRHNITVFPIDINTSNKDHICFYVEGKPYIRLGLRLIKGLSQHAISHIIKFRIDNGRFNTLLELKRLNINEKDMLALASANALHSISGDRYQTRWHLLDTHSELPFFSDQHSQSATPKMGLKAQIREDYASTGLTLNHHPIAILKLQGCLHGVTFAEQLVSKRHKSVVSIVGCVTLRQAPGTAKGVQFMTLEDHTGNINVVIWQNTMRSQKRAILTASILRVDGILEISQEGVTHVIAGRLTDLTHLFKEVQISSHDYH